MNLRLKRSSLIKSKLLFQKAYSKDSSVQVLTYGKCSVRFFLLDEVLFTDRVLAAFLASKRNYRKAHQRNRIKRLLREGHRLNTSVLLNRLPDGQGIALFWSFKGDVNVSFHEINNNMQRLISRILEKLEPST